MFSGCAPATPAVTPLAIRMEYSAATEPYLQTIHACSGGTIIDARPASMDHFSANNTDLTMRIGEATDSTASSFQISADSIQVIVSASNPRQELSLVQVRDLFSGRILSWKDLQGSDKPVEVWVYSSGEDVEQLFEQTALQSTPISSLAHLAVSPEQMAAAVAQDANSIGILTKSWKADGIKSVYTVADEPVLLYTASEPQGAIQEIINCLQK
jgi:hypothetical protein